MPLNWRKLELKILWTDNLWNRWTKLEKLYNLNPVQRSPNPLSHAVDAVRLCSTQGSFCGAVLGQLAQIPSQQRSASYLSHAGDHGSPVLHAPLGSASQGFAHILPRTASLIPLSCHMREINQTNHSLSSHSPANQTPCSPSNFFPRKLFKKVRFTSLTFPAQSIEQCCHCCFSVHNSTCPSHPYPQKKNKLI